jgi:CheY-like chemotaxis protein
LLNYVGNAIKFTETGQITLRVLPVAAPMRPTLLGPACAASAPHGHASAPTSASDPGSVLIRFEVQDSGVGIAADVLPRLFTAFEQADNSTTRRHGGTGLGLTIVRQLALLMGGETGVISTPGRGSTFWFTARLQRAPRPAVVAAARIGTAEMRLARDHAGARVLLVDDEPMVRIVTRELLRCVFTHVDMAHDGRQALRLAGLHAYDLILMDVQMPGMDGLAATRLIRTLPGGRYVPILGVTANAFAEDMAACRGAGMDGFLAKPYAAEQLFDTMLQALLGPEHGGAATTPASAAGLFSVHSATPPPGVPAGRSAGA